MKNVINKIFKAISSAIFVILVMIIAIILLYVIYVQVMTSNGKSSEIKINFYTILTQSMYPTISAGDIVVSFKNDKDIYQVGDIITFVSTSSSSNGLTITHRVIEVFELNGDYSYKTQGDNNNVSDSSAVPSKNVIGKVVFKVPKAGYLQQFLVTKTGWIVAIVLPCLGIIIYDILKMLRTIKTGSKSKIKISEDDSVKVAKEKLNNIISSNDKIEKDSVDNIFTGNIDNETNVLENSSYPDNVNNKNMAIIKSADNKENNINNSLSSNVSIINDDVISLNDGNSLYDDVNVINNNVDNYNNIINGDNADKQIYNSVDNEIKNNKISDLVNNSEVNIVSNSINTNVDKKINDDNYGDDDIEVL